jgi:TatD DNase family protein
MEHLYDTHFHLDLQKDRSAVIREIEQNQVYTIAVTNLRDLYRKEIREIKSKYIRLALGLHPELIHQYNNQIHLMWDLLPEVRYVGEVGLDFVDLTYQQEQVAFFSELIERCRYDAKKIVTIHSRRAVSKVLEIIGHNFQFKPILHWFTGNTEELHEAIGRGYFFSVNGAMLASKRFLDLLPIIPSDRILIETDSPFTFLNQSYINTLKQIEVAVKTQRQDVDVWENFRRVLG